ncbi:MAG: type II toxin-antitoxin system HicB family antitoxin [Anaerolineae bacterium]|nr:type II toxin-antitoxin system HicB family antitoxin [Anaerolineae bacterium]
MSARQVILHPAEEGGYWVEVPSLPGCISQGDTKEEALANIREAIELFIEALEEIGEEVPPAHPFIVETVEA